MVVRSRFAALVAAAVLLLLPLSVGQAQRRAQPGRFEVPGFDFTPDGAWRKRAAAVRANRRNLMRNNQIDALNRSGPGANVLTGTVVVPIVLIQYSNVSGPFPMAQYQDVMFNPAPSTRPYSYKSFYEKLSRNHITVTGTVFDWVTATQNDLYYEDGCNAIGPGCGSPIPGVGVSTHFRELLVEAVGDVGAVNWGQFDNDGLDNVPNSGDDDGEVDFIIFLQPETDGACGGNNIWAHRFSLAGLGAGAGGVTTATPRSGGGFIRVNNYIIQAGQGGGNQGCTAGQLMQMGTTAHETGHAFGLPDLYDTSLNSEGIGEWGLMGSGNYARAYSPSAMEGWSLAELGWISVDTLSTTASLVTLNPVATSDTVLYIPIPATDEYLLLENRDSLESDTAQMSSAMGNGKKNPGLLIWHIDQGIINVGTASNAVNAGPIHGVALEQADGLNELRTLGGGRGDTGDSYPGSSNNTRYSFTSNPSAQDNQGAFDGFAIDSIIRIASPVPNQPSPITFRFTKRERSLFSTTRNGATIKVNGVSYTSYDDVVPPGDQVQLDVTSPQTITSGRTQLTFLSWSDGGASAHTLVSGATAPDTVLASFSANHKLNLVTAPSGGTVASDLPGTPNLVVGVFVQENQPVTLTATPTSGGTFVRWQGDTTTTNAVLVLPMGRPYSLTAIFSGSVVIVTQDAVNALLGAACTQTPCMSSAQLTFMDQSGNNDGVYNLGDFLAHADRTGLNPGSPVMQQLLSQPTTSVPLSGPAKR